MLPELRLLEYFVAVAEELHFSRAAQRLVISQPALSRHIARLERDLGTALLVRTSRSVHLTTAGAVLLSEAQRTLRAAEHAVDLAQRTGRGDLGRVRIGFLTSAWNSVLPPVIRQFQAQHPNVLLTFQADLDGEQIDRLHANQIDLGFVRTRVVHPDIQCEPVLTEPFAAVLPTDHALAPAAQLALGALANESFILWPRAEAPASYDALITACADAGFHPHVVFHLDHAPAILGMVAAGMGVSVLASSYRTLHREGIVFIPLQTLVTTLYIVWMPHRASPALDQFLRVIWEQTAS